MRLSLHKRIHRLFKMSTPNPSRPCKENLGIQVWWHMSQNIEAGRLWVQGWPVVYSKTIAQKTGDEHIKKKLSNFLWEAESMCMFCPTGAVLSDPSAADLLRKKTLLFQSSKQGGHSDKRVYTRLLFKRKLMQSIN